MADVQTAEPKGAGKTALGLRKRKRVGIRVDMTPMVDVAFLLLIFFMVTTVFRRPLAMEMNLPESGAKVKIKESNVMTIYIEEDGTMVYDVGKRGLQPLPWDELRQTLVLEHDYNPDLVTLVKIDRKAKYDQMVNMLDTLDEAQMTRFSIVPMTDLDKTALQGGGL
ncbi:MAG TPA: biopolymer transporter ExbD [Candidatus Krumholzibacteria bacterium]|nr:biopolymer transporter ExbD [Candidatus Krumholzibacteria bacterium]